MKTTSFVVLAAGTTLVLLAGCAAQPPTGDVDAIFLQQVAQQDLLEIRLGELADQNAALLDVRAYGRQMAEKHKQSLQELGRLAKARQETVPAALDDDGMATYLQLSHDRDNEFARKYVDDAVQIHHAELDALQREVSIGADPTLVAFARDVMPVVTAEVQLGVDVKFRDVLNSPKVPPPKIAKVN